MDRAYKKMRMTAEESGYAPVVPPKRNYKEQWEYDAMKLSDSFGGFILLAVIIDSLV